MISLQEVGNPHNVFYLNGKVYKFPWFKNINLRSSTPVSVGIDQSSTNTGIAIVGDDLLYITELTRGDIRVPTYRRALTQQLTILLQGLEVKYFIYEKHGAHITPLESVINTVTDSIKSFSRFHLDNRHVEVSGVSPSLWRSGYLTSPEYENRFTRDEVKVACVEECLKLYPSLSKYVKYSNEDYDGFEALGIVKGYLNLNYDSNGVRVVNRTMERYRGKRGKYQIHKCYKHELTESIQRLCKSYNIHNPVLVRYNPEIFIDEAVSRLNSVYKECIIIYDECPEYCRFILETGEAYSTGEVYYVYCSRS